MTVLNANERMKDLVEFVGHEFFTKTLILADNLIVTTQNDLFRLRGLKTHLDIVLVCKKQFLRVIPQQTLC